MRCLTTEIVRGGGGLVLLAGKEPFQAADSPGSPPIIFDWTILEVAESIHSLGRLPWPHTRPPIVAVISEKAETEIPPHRRALWEKLLGSNLVRIEYIQPGARSGALLRERQAQFGSVLICIGGGTGVEHLADLYQARHKPVIPLDLPIGASREDGIGGSERMNREAKAHPAEFLRLHPERSEAGATLLAATGTLNGTVELEKVTSAVIRLLTAIDHPNAFYVRLLNKKMIEFPAVEFFFREIVDATIEKICYRRLEVGTDRAEHGFMNVDIFQQLHYSALAIIDVTGERPNCFIELGYALGRGIPVIVTAKEGTILPFDQNAIPCHFWNLEVDIESNRRQLLDFIEKNIGRPPLVTT
jgi:hypothetical protein